MTSPSRIILASDNAALQERFAAGLGDMAALAVVSPAAGELLAAVVEARPTLIVVELSAHTTLHPLVALVRRADGTIVKNALDLKIHEPIEIEFGQGRARAEVTRTDFL